MSPVCPSGAHADSDVEASQDGLFMTDDGRAFFATEDPLVHADTNRAQDVYEYVEGRPQLITPAPGTPGRRTRRLSSPKHRRDWSGSAPTATTSTSRPTTPWSRRTTTASSSSSTTPARAAASPLPPRRRPARRPTSATAPAASRPRRRDGTGAALGAGGNAVTERQAAARARRSRKRHHGKRHRRQSEPIRGGPAR